MWQFVGLLGGLGGRFGAIMCEIVGNFPMS